MFRTGHLGLAILCWTVVAAALLLPDHPALAVFGGLVCVWFATVPDVDMSLPGVQHRGPTHSLVFSVVFGGVVAAVVLSLHRVAQLPVASSVWASLREPLAAVAPEVLAAFVDALPGVVTVAAISGLAATVSVLSHVLGDALTPAGVELFWPVNTERYSLDLVLASNAVANYLAFVVGVGAVVAALAWQFGALGPLGGLSRLGGLP